MEYGWSTQAIYRSIVTLYFNLFPSHSSDSTVIYSPYLLHVGKVKTPTLK